MSEQVRHGVIMYNRKAWECDTCGKTNDAELGYCPQCREGHLEHGGLLNGEQPYFPEWHTRQAGFDFI